MPITKSRVILHIKAVANHDKRRCDCKELDDWTSCKTGYITILVHVIASGIKHVKWVNNNIFFMQETFFW